MWVIAGCAAVQLGYHLLVFVYEKFDDAALQAAHLNIKHTIFVH